jgi:threonine dehydrogenase-like Zn-dependent dehydrogenase
MAGAAAQFFKVPAANVHRIPDGVALDEAVLAEPSVTILNSFEMGNIQPGERVAVIGTGTMGLIAIQIASHMGCLVDSIGVVDSELTVARDLGANNTFKPQTAPDGAYSAVIEASGSSSVGPELARIAAIGGRIMQVGIPGSPVDGFDLAAFVSKGLSLIGVLGGVHLMPKALELIRKGAIRPDGLIDEVIDSSRIEEAFERAATGGRGKPKILVDLRSLGQQEAATMKEANG